MIANDHGEAEGHFAV